MSDFWDTFSGLFDSDTSGFGWEDILPILVGVGGAQGWFGGGGSQPVGYQGGIPEYTAVRRRVQPAQNRRPGGPGQRYFSDVVYAQGAGSPPPLDVAREKAFDQAQGLAALNRQNRFAGGGLASLGTYMRGASDGMGDRVPATISGQEPARLSHGEFVVPADVVSHLGNGNSDAGAKQLYAMLDRVRQGRTGRRSQARQINPNRYMPR